MTSPASENSPISSSASGGSRRSSASVGTRRSFFTEGLTDITNFLTSTDLTVVSKNLKRRRLRMKYKKRILRREQSSVPDLDRIVDIDVNDKFQAAKETAKNMKTKELRYAFTATWEHVTFRNGIRSDMYEKVCMWLLEVVDVFNMELRTFLLALNYFRRFLAQSTTPTRPSSLQLLAVTCLFLSYKFHENTETITTTFLSKLTEHWCSPRQIQLMENEVLNDLKFLLNPALPLDFTHRLLTAAAVHDDGASEEREARLNALSSVFTEVTAGQSFLFGVSPSLHAAAATALARATLHLPPWGRTFLHYAEHSKEDIQQLASSMIRVALQSPPLLEKRLEKAGCSDLIHNAHSLSLYDQFHLTS